MALLGSEKRTKDERKADARAAADAHTPSAPRKKRSRAVRILRGIGAFLLSVVVFGIVVSVTSYLRTPAVLVGASTDSSVQIREVTQLHTVRVAHVVTPRSIEDISNAVKATPGPVSIGGGRYSMGGQTATPDGLQLDMRSYHGVISLDTARRIVTVRSGTKWRELQEVIDKANLSVKIMQTYNSFTVGGALSVNAHGRYIGQGPLVRSVREITLVLADGSIVKASSTENADLFFAAVGGYGSVGVVADITLDLAENSRVRRDDEKMPIDSYLAYFRKNIRDDSTMIFHNADIYPPNYEAVHAVSYRKTNEPVTVPERLLPADQNSWAHRTVYNIMMTWPKGKAFREYIVDPILFRGNPVTWRNYESSYDVSELEPKSRDEYTYVLQEYFIPVDSVMVFVRKMRTILQQHDVNAMNVSIRHALPDPGTFLAWAPNEVFAFVLYYRQGTDPAARRAVWDWTRELIDAAIASGGRYYLPYQPIATRAQFAAAYPNSAKLFDVKHRVDPTHKFTNALWDLYGTNADGSVPPVTASRLPANLSSEVRTAIDTIPGYNRNEMREFLTHPEWDLVYGSEAYAKWLEDGKRPSQFPYIGSVGTFWRSYAGTQAAADTRYHIDAGTHVMLNVIGVSTAIEYGIKGVYEGTIGRLVELTMPDGGTNEDRYAAKVARDYAKLIATKGWYEFDFGGALRGLWNVPAGPGFVRRWERRFVLSAEYLIKMGYAKLIGAGTAAGYTPDELTRYMVAAGWNDSLSTVGLHRVKSLDRDYALLAVGRYDPYRDGLLKLSDHADRVRLAEVSGSEIVTLSGTAPKEWRMPPRVSSVVAYAMPDYPSRTRMLLRVSARDLLDVLREMRQGGVFRVEHIYDY